MAIRPEVLRALEAAGASLNMILAAIEAERAAEDREHKAALESKRAKDAERQRKHRNNVTNVTRDGRDDPPVTRDRRDAAPTEPNPVGSNTTPPKGGEDNSTHARDPHRLPADFALSEADRQFVRDLGWSDAEISDEFSGFVDYWSNPKLPGSKALKSNWSATWRNRIRDLSKRRGHAQRPDAQRSFRVVNGSNGHVQTARGSAAQFLRADIERELREAGGEGERIRSLEFLPQLGRG
jgi:hypothetical protein